MPDTNVAIVTDSFPETDCFDDVIEADTTDTGPSVKIRNIAKTPYDRTVFLDTDVYTAEPFHELFDILDTHAIAAAHKPDYMERWQVDLGVPESYQEYNTGVIAFRSDSIDPIRDTWLNYNDEVSLSHDQAAFRAALYESDVRTATLPYRYNLRYTGISAVSSLAKLLHSRPVEYNYGSEAFDNYISSVVSKINRSDVPRVVISHGGELRVITDDRSQYLEHSRTSPIRSTAVKIRASIDHNGIFDTVRRGLKRILS